jgi:ribosomal protein L31
LKLDGFIGPAYTLDSVNVDAQRCVNLYPEVIESGKGKGAQVAYLKSTPGLELLLTVGDGPIRCMHTDALGRTFVVSGNKIYVVSHKDNFHYLPRQVGATSDLVVQGGSTIDISTDEITSNDHGFYTGQQVQVSSSGTLPAGLTVLTDYYLIVLSSNVYKFATSLANALAGIDVDITNVGSGNMTVTSQTSTTVSYIQNADIDLTTDTFTMRSHGMYTGMKVQISTDGVLPTGLSAGTDYYIIASTSNTFKLASSSANAEAGTAVDITAFYSSTDWVSTLMTTTGTDSGGSAFTLETSSGPVYAASSQNIVEFSGNNYVTEFVDGTDEYSFIDSLQGSMTLGPLLGSSQPVTNILWLDSYYIRIFKDFNTFYVSTLGGVAFGDDFASAEGDPDKILSIVKNFRQLYLFGEKTIEIFSNTGNSAFPFERVPGGYIEVGTSAKDSVRKIKETIFWLGRTNSGANSVYAMRGNTPQRISTHAIEQAISSYADPASATAYTYAKNGHDFYVLNFAEATWVYNMSNGLWHERAYTNSGTLERHRAEQALYFAPKDLNLVGDYESGKIYKLNDSYYSDNGDAITRLRTSPHISSGLDRIFCSKFQLDMETGIGLDGDVQGSDPTVMLDFSDDGGHTWSSESWALADAGSGQIGNFKKRVIWRRLGSFRDRIFRVKITDPVPVTLIDAQLEVKKGAN